MIWCIKTYIIAYVKIQQNEGILSIMSNLQPNCCLNRFPKGDQHAGGKWLIHDTKRRKDNQLQSPKLPCRISKLSNKMWHKGVRWHLGYELWISVIELWISILQLWISIIQLWISIIQLWISTTANQLRIKQQLWISIINYGYPWLHYG